MRKLTQYQKEFMLEHFFKNDRYAGWQNIATALLYRGECLVAGLQCIWIGGIGNHIKTEDAKDAFGCLLYKFDLERFLATAWYKNVKKEYAKHLADKKRRIEQEHKEICSLTSTRPTNKKIK